MGLNKKKLCNCFSLKFSNVEVNLKSKQFRELNSYLLKKKKIVMWASMYIWEPGKVVPIYNPSTQRLKSGIYKETVYSKISK